MLSSMLPFVGLVLSAPNPQVQVERSWLKPIAAPVREATVRLDRATGSFRKMPKSLGIGIEEIVYNNDCTAGYYIGQDNTGGSQVFAILDEGRLPNTASAATSRCLSGCFDSYEITQFQIGYCTDTGLAPRNIVHFWQTSTTSSCADFVLIGGQVPPILPTVASVTVTGLPRSSAPGTLACYVVNVDLGTPGFTLNGSVNAVSGRFKWSTQFPDSTGNDGPLFAGNLFWASPCLVCFGSMWEAPNQTTRPGSGLDTQDQIGIEDYGGTLGSGCYFSGPSSPYFSHYLRLFAEVPCDPTPSDPPDNGLIFVEEIKITAGDASPGDLFGSSVSLSGDTAVIGAFGDDDAGSSSGSAYVLVPSGSTWTQQQKLTALDAAAQDNFGHSTSISGHTAVIGTPGDDDVGANSGSAYVFVRSGSIWTQQQKLTALDAAAQDNFGSSVSLSGDTAVIGATGDDPAGSAYVFVRSGSVWMQQQKLTALDAAGGDNFGCAVSISDDTAAIGARGDDDAGSASGSAYVFVRSGSTWTQQQKLTASDAAAEDIFGNSVSISGDTVVIGAPLSDRFSSGSAYVFVRSGSTWTEQQELVPTDQPVTGQFGSSVSISGDTILGGAWSDDHAGDQTGSAYVYMRYGTTWVEEQKLTASDAFPIDYYGMSVSISGDAAVIGAYGNDDFGSGSGSAYALQALIAPFCAAASLVACPCGNPGAPNTGCDNAAATGGVLARVTGFDILAQSGTISGSGFPPTTSPTALLIRANSTELSPVVFGDGIRCVGLQGLVRLAATLASGGTSTHAFSHGAGPGAFHYQIWYRSNPASYCTSAAFNLSSGRSITW